LIVPVPLTLPLPYIERKFCGIRLAIGSGGEEGGGGALMTVLFGAAAPPGARLAYCGFCANQAACAAASVGK